MLKVKEMRLKRKISQVTLSQSLGMSSSFVSHVESMKRRAKYNVSHLNEIAKILDCSPRDFWPEEAI
jgi:DNA-binding Xre family transcriptional regulator